MVLMLSCFVSPISHYKGLQVDFLFQSCFYSMQKLSRSGLLDLQSLLLYMECFTIVVLKDIHVTEPCQLKNF